jgi:hypothetical protein
LGERATKLNGMLREARKRAVEPIEPRPDLQTILFKHHLPKTEAERSRLATITNTPRHPSQLTQETRMKRMKRARDLEKKLRRTQTALTLRENIKKQRKFMAQRRKKRQEAIIAKENARRAKYSGVGKVNMQLAMGQADLGELQPTLKLGPGRRTHLEPITLPKSVALEQRQKVYSTQRKISATQKLIDAEKAKLERLQREQKRFEMNQNKKKQSKPLAVGSKKTQNTLSPADRLQNKTNSMLRGDFSSKMPSRPTTRRSSAPPLTSRSRFKSAKDTTKPLNILHKIISTPRLMKTVYNPFQRHHSAKIAHKNVPKKNKQNNNNNNNNNTQSFLPPNFKPTAKKIYSPTQLYTPQTKRFQKIALAAGLHKYLFSPKKDQDAFQFIPLKARPRSLTKFRKTHEMLLNMAHKVPLQSTAFLSQLTTQLNPAFFSQNEHPMMYLFRKRLERIEQKQGGVVTKVQFLNLFQKQMEFLSIKLKELKNSKNLIQNSQYYSTRDHKLKLHQNAAAQNYFRDSLIEDLRQFSQFIPIFTPITSDSLSPINNIPVYTHPSAHNISQNNSQPLPSSLPNPRRRFLSMGMGRPGNGSNSSTQNRANSTLVDFHVYKQMSRLYQKELYLKGQLPGSERYELDNWMGHIHKDLKDVEYAGEIQSNGKKLPQLLSSQTSINKLNRDQIKSFSNTDKKSQQWKQRQDFISAKQSQQLLDSAETAAGQKNPVDNLAHLQIDEHASNDEELFIRSTTSQLEQQSGQIVQNNTPNDNNYQIIRKQVRDIPQKIKKTPKNVSRPIVQTLPPLTPLEQTINYIRKSCQLEQLPGEYKSSQFKYRTTELQPQLLLSNPLTSIFSNYYVDNSPIPPPYMLKLQQQQQQQQHTMNDNSIVSKGKDKPLEEVITDPSQQSFSSINSQRKVVNKENANPRHFGNVGRGLIDGLLAAPVSGRF